MSSDLEVREIVKRHHDIIVHAKDECVREGITSILIFLIEDTEGKAQCLVIDRAHENAPSWIQNIRRTIIKEGDPVSKLDEGLSWIMGENEYLVFVWGFGWTSSIRMRSLTPLSVVAVAVPINAKGSAAVN